MKILLPAAALLVAATPLAIADHAVNGCHGGPGVVTSSCVFECYAGQFLGAWAHGLAYATARCGGAEACSPSACWSQPVVQHDGYGTCEVWGYVWLGYGCEAT
ncbi:MAG TPA: hypothetical protein VM582_00565 [Candidatus Thermoplasmatota archaeon]|nr:hypothetical protein [Candidatus Thermoplasmatota archaeon]